MLTGEIESNLFRVIPPHPDDQGKTRIRIEKHQMKMLGIESGDVVKVKGIGISGAVCLPLEKEYALPYDPDFTFLYEPSKYLPIVRLSDIVSQNASRMGSMSVVQISKIHVLKAKKITLALKNKQQMYNQDDLILSDLEGMIVTRGNHIRIINKKSTKYPFIQFIVVDLNTNIDFCLITKETQFEFTTSDQSTILHTPTLHNLKKIIQIGKQITDKKLTVILHSLEIYDDGTKFLLNLSYIFDEPVERLHDRVYCQVSVADNLGNVYTCIDLRMNHSRWHRGEPQHSEMSGILIPPMSNEASELIFTIKEITWQKRKRSDNELDKTENRNTQTKPLQWSIQKSHYLIANGNWEFKIKLK